LPLKTGKKTGKQKEANSRNLAKLFETFGRRPSRPICYFKDFELLVFSKTVLEKLGINGGENPKVGEHCGVVVFELDAYSEPKMLAQADLQRLFDEAGTIEAVARRTGLGWSTIQEKLKPARKWDPKKKVFVRLKPKLK
jgi:hypothetical protein